jgi:hypothetical protein
MVAADNARNLYRDATMGKEIRLTAPTLKIIGALMLRTREIVRAEIGATTKLPSATLYPILVRLEGAGWLEAARSQKTRRSSVGHAGAITV